MTDLELLQYVDSYFARHLDSGYWSSLADDTREASVAMALSDVLAEMQVAEANADNPPMLKAVAEQAVYLARNYSDLTENKIVTGEGVEGISTNYTLLNKNAGLSHRAAAFIQQARTYRICGPVRFGRG